MVFSNTFIYIHVSKNYNVPPNPVIVMLFGLTIRLLNVTVKMILNILLYPLVAMH
jgi:hypothetical protein